MSTLPALYDTQFDLDMLRDIALLEAPETVAEQYGYDYDRIKDLPNFKAQLARVESELFNDGTLTRAMAEMGLNKAVEIMNIRIAGGAISNDDLNKFTNTLHKVTNRDGKNETLSNRPQFSIEINLGGTNITLSSSTQQKIKDVENELDDEDPDAIEDLEGFDSEERYNGVTSLTSKGGEVPILDEFEEDDVPEDLLESIRLNSDFGLEVD